MVKIYSTPSPNPIPEQPSLPEITRTQLNGLSDDLYKLALAKPSDISPPLPIVQNLVKDILDKINALKTELTEYLPHFHLMDLNMVLHNTDGELDYANLASNLDSFMHKGEDLFNDLNFQRTALSDSDQAQIKLELTAQETARPIE